MAADGAAITRSQTLDLLCQMLQVQGLPVLGPQGFGLRLRSGIEIGVIGDLSQRVCSPVNSGAKPSHLAPTIKPPLAHRGIGLDFPL